MFPRFVAAQAGAVAASVGRSNRHCHPHCAAIGTPAVQGRPLRALAVAGNDSKFFERHDGVFKALLDERFEGEASRQGLTAFLMPAPRENTGYWWHPWPMVCSRFAASVSPPPLQKLPYPVAAFCWWKTNVACTNYLRPCQTPSPCSAVALNLSWLSAPWLQERNVAYWGDLDTWGLAMLARARLHVPILVCVADGSPHV